MTHKLEIDFFCAFTTVTVTFILIRQRSPSYPFQSTAQVLLLFPYVHFVDTVHTMHLKNAVDCGYGISLIRALTFQSFIKHYIYMFVSFLFWYLLSSRFLRSVF